VTSRGGPGAPGAAAGAAAGSPSPPNSSPIASSSSAIGVRGAVEIVARRATSLRVSASNAPRSALATPTPRVIFILSGST
jgi:hypothetical protein